MGGFFNLDNPFFAAVGKAFDMMVISILWLVLCLPIVTAGPATTALYYTVVKVIRRERSYALKEFFRSFKLNLKQGMLLSVLLFALVWLMYVDFTYAQMLADAENAAGTWMFGAFVVIALLLSGTALYVFPLLSRFNMTFVRLLKSSFFMAVRYLPTTAVLLLLAVLCGGLIWIIPVTAVIVPALAMLAASFLLERIFKKYMPAAEGTPEETGQDQWYLE